MKEWMKPEIKVVNKNLLLFDILILVLTICESLSGRVDELAGWIGLTKIYEER